MVRLLCICIAALFCAVPQAFDFRPYCTIDSATKAHMLSIRHANPAYTPGNVTLFGNSITYTMAFWAPYQYDAPGPVPGTNAGTYGIKNCAYSGWQITDGLGCVSSACQTETPEVCIIQFGTNDINGNWTGITNGSFGTNYRRFLDTVLSYGCIPIVSTIPPVRWDGNNAQWDLRCAAVNDTIKRAVAAKQVLMVDFWQAFMDFTGNNPFTSTWFGDQWVHPSGGTNMTDTANPTCGYGIRNAVCWQAVNTAYRQIIDGDTTGGTTEPAVDSMEVPASQDAWLSGCCGEENTACGASSYAPDWMRFKGSDNGQMALQFNMSQVTSDTSVIVGGTAFIRPVASPYASTYSYVGLACALSGTWNENTITYNMATPNVTTAGSRSVSYNAAPGSAFHPFPVSAKIVKGMKQGTYTGIVVKDLSGSTENQDFATKEAGVGFEPYLRVYFSALVTRADNAAETSSGEPSLTASPNPFNPSITITVSARNARSIRVAIYDVSGQLVQDLTSALSNGKALWNAAGQPSGTYMVKAWVGDNVLTKAITLLK